MQKSDWRVEQNLIKISGVQIYGQYKREAGDRDTRKAPRALTQGEPLNGLRFTRHYPTLLHKGDVKRSIDRDEESGALILRPRIMNHLRGHVRVIAWS